MSTKPTIHTCLSPALLHLYDLSESVVVIIDVLRATSTIAAALHNGARHIIPVEKVSECIELGKKIDGITAGERDGRVAEGLQYGNSPFEYPASFISDKVLILTTTNGTKLLHMAVAAGAAEIITGAFSNLSAVCQHLIDRGKPVVLACAAWKDRVNLEDTLFAGAVVNQLLGTFDVPCDASKIAASLFKEAQPDVFEFMKNRNASHYRRLMGFGLERDIRHCLTPDTAPVLPIFREEKLLKCVD
jgi:2-phosphosulfolactate phosphatase